MSRDPHSEQITGVLEKIVYSNEENHYLIGHLRPDGKQAVSITIAGNLPGIQCGETLEISGTWKNHPRFGMQFSIRDFKSKLPASTYGIRKYLGSGLVKGIGKTYANKIVDHFGAKTLEVISHQSARLREVEGIGSQRAKSIKQAWDEQQIYREVMIFLQTHNVSNAQCIRLVKRYGNDTIRVLREDPYILAREIDGIGFLTADKIAHNLGIPSNSEKRIHAGIFHCLTEAGGHGHTCLHYEDLLQQSTELLDCDSQDISAQLLALINAKQLRFPRNEVVQLPNLFTYEETIARAIQGIVNQSSSLPPIKTEIAVDWFEEKSHFKLAPAQREAILTSLRAKVSVITGGPGTGKTTLLRGMVSILKAKKVKVVLASPTGRAAKRLAEATGGFAQTIHRLLGYDPAKNGFVHNESNPLRADFIIVDESSMLDSYLAACLFRAIPHSSHLLLVGDIDQLPSVGSGNVLADLISSKQIPVTRLSFIYRQSKGSEISSVAHGILRGAVAPGRIVDHVSEIDRRDEIVFIRCDTPEILVDSAVQLIRQKLPQILPDNLVKETQVLAPLHKGIAGTQNLNQILQGTLNPSKQEIRFGFESFRPGDRIIQTRNNYDKSVFNGDIGKITSIDGEAGLIRVDFDGNTIEYERSEFSEFQLAYAISIHKSQGSEYPIVIIPLMKQHFVMLERNLVYTAVTRGKQKVYFLGQIDAFAMAVKNQKTQQRLTNLVPQLLQLDR